MKQLRRALSWAIIDTVIMLVAYSLAYMARSVSAPLNYMENFIFIIFAVQVTLLAAYSCGIYRRMWRGTSGNDVIVIVFAIFIATLVTLSIDLLFTRHPMPVSVVLLGNALTMVGMTAARFRSRLLIGLQWRWRAVWNREFPQKRTRVLVVGAGKSGQDLARRIHEHLHDQFLILGFVDDDPDKLDLYIDGVKILGNRWSIPEHVADLSVDMIIVAMHRIEGRDFREILSLCHQTRADVKVVPDTVSFLMDADATVPNHQQKIWRDVQPEDLLGRSAIGRHEKVTVSPVTNKVILITGAAGSIGSELTRQMATYKPYQLIMLDNNESALHDLQIGIAATHPDISVTPLLADITQINTVRAVFDQYRPDIVFHAAAYKHVPMLQYFPNEAVRVNVLGTRNVATTAMEYECERFVFISTDKAVNPSNVMGATKRIGELLIDALSQRPGCKTYFTSVRFGNVLGSRGSVVPTFTKQLDKGGPITITDYRMTRYFMSIPEAVNLVIHAACLTDNNDIFVLRMGDSVKIIDIAERMIRLRGLTPHRDIQIKEIGIRSGEKLHEELHTEHEHPADTLHPYIFRLENGKPACPPDELLKRIDQLIQRNLTTSNDPLETIQMIIEAEALPGKVTVNDGSDPH